MTPTYWIGAYGIEEEKEYSETFDSNVKPLNDGPKFFDHYKEKMPTRMKTKSIFCELPYWEHLNIFHLLDPMHIFKNVSSSLWRHISSKKSGILTIRRDFISSTTKKEH